MNLLPGQNTIGSRGSEILIVTLGVEPQVVTIVLDRLLAQGKTIGLVIVVYTESPPVIQALSAVQNEFESHIYPGITLRIAPVTLNEQPVRDFSTDEDLRGLLRTLYTEVRWARQAGFRIHLCISGGRKVMGILAMVVAQLLFGLMTKSGISSLRDGYLGLNAACILPRKRKYGWYLFQFCAGERREF